MDIVADFPAKKDFPASHPATRGNADPPDVHAPPPFDVHAVELRRGTETRIGTVASRSQVLRVVVSTCASAVNATMRRGERRGRRSGTQGADDDENGSNGNGGVGVAVDAMPELAASHGAVRLASSVGDEAGRRERRGP